MRIANKSLQKTMSAPLWSSFIYCASINYKSNQFLKQLHSHIHIKHFNCRTQDEYIRASSNSTEVEANAPVVLSHEIHLQNNTSGDSDVYTYHTIQTIPREIIVVDNTTYDLLDRYVSMYIYSGFIIGVILVTIIRSFLFFKVAMIASKRLHSRMFHALLEAPMRFFDTNPSGRVLNRFSKDMGAIDEMLPRVLLEAIQVKI